MINPWEVSSGVFTVIFFLGAFYFLASAGIKDYGKRGMLFVVSALFLGPGFLFDLIAEVYEIETAELLSHGAVLIAGLLFLLSSYLSQKELLNERGESK